MKAVLPGAQCHEFCFPRRDTLLQVEVAGEDVLIRATRDTFPEAARLSFIHELAAEGFIPDRYAWLPLAGAGWLGGIHWVVDHSWLVITEAVRAPARRFMRRLFAGAFCLWLTLMAFLLLGGRGPGAFFVASKSPPPSYSAANPPAGPRGPAFTR